MKITKFEDCVEGMKVKAVLFKGVPPIDGVIATNHRIKMAWLLHNAADFDGNDCETYDVDKKGFKYSWALFSPYKKDDPLFFSIESDDSLKDGQRLYKLSELREDMCVKCETSPGKSFIGYIHLASDDAYILSNDPAADGWKSPDMKGYKYSWEVIGDAGDISTMYTVTYVETPKTTETIDTTKAELIYKLDGVFFTKTTIDDEHLATLQAELTHADSRIIYLKKLLATHAKLFPTKE